MNDVRTRRLIFDSDWMQPAAPQALDVEFTVPEAGWIWGCVKPLHDLPALACSHIYDPFAAMISWLEQIIAGADAATWLINHENHVSRLQFYGGLKLAGDESDHLLHIQSDQTIKRVRAVAVRREQLVKAFYRGFRDMAEDPSYDPPQWDRHPDYHSVHDIEDDETFRVAKAAYPFSGSPLRELTSSTIEVRLGGNAEARG